MIHAYLSLLTKTRQGKTKSQTIDYALRVNGSFTNALKYGEVPFSVFPNKDQQHRNKKMRAKDKKVILSRYFLSRTCITQIVYNYNFCFQVECSSNVAGQCFW